MESIGAFLQLLANLMISPQAPIVDSPDWTALTKEWKAEASVLTFTAVSRTLPDYCRANPEHRIVTPIILQGNHEFLGDGKLLVSSGDPSFKQARSIYNVGVLNCREIGSVQELTWKAHTATHSLALLHSYPKAYATLPAKIWFCRPLILMISGALLTIVLTGSITFFGKIPTRVILAFAGSAIAFSVSYLFSVPDYFDLHITPLTSQKFSDSLLWLGFALTFMMLSLLNHVSVRTSKFITTFSFLGITAVVLSQNLDQIQVGSNFAIFTVLTSIIVAFFQGAKRRWKEIVSPGRGSLEFLILIIFVVACVNDSVLFFFGTNSVPLLPVGTLANLSLMALAVNHQINQTYDERDHLRENLETEVTIKTSELTMKTVQLEKTLLSLKEAQADLVQSAKLASVGTLAAGIAHEINNSLNYVNGSIYPLENWLKQQDVVSKDKPLKLIGLMKEGLTLTFDIISNLKRQTSSNQEEKEKLNIKEITDGAILILGYRLKGIKVETEIEPGLTLELHRAGLSQIIMNLVGNAAEAIDEWNEKNSEKRPGVVTVKAFSDSDSAKICVSDNGPGIPKDVLGRMFEPFFTTKPVGKGTGLGLYIVRAEIEKLGGTVQIDTEVGKGTTFIISIPKSQLRSAA